MAEARVAKFCVQNISSVIIDTTIQIGDTDSFKESIILLTEIHKMSDHFP